MPQVVVWERQSPQRDALVYVLREAGLDVLTVDSREQLRDELRERRFDCLICCEQSLEAPTEFRTALGAGAVGLIILVETGNFRGIVRALAAGADEIISRDLPAGELVARVRHVIDHPPASPPSNADVTEVQAELDGKLTSFRVAPHRLFELAAQLCEDAARLHRRYDTELAHRRRVEQALMESETFYQSLVETLPLAMFRKDLLGRVTFANRLMCEALRRPAAEIIGKTDYDFFPRELAEKYRADDRRVAETRTNFETVEEFQTPSGERRAMHVVKTPVYDAAGQLVGVQGVFSDVTDRMRAEAALEQERHLLDSLMQSIPDNIYFKDAEGRYLRINPAKAASSGLKSPADAIGKTDHDFFSPEHAAAAQADERDVMLNRRPLIGKEERISYPDGRVRWMSTTKLPLVDREGRVIGTFGVSRDITQLKQAQAALQDAVHAAESANKAKSDFLANMSHEIRTPLNAVLGMTELVLETPLTPVQRDYLKLVHESGESLLAVINDVLDFSKIEAGKLQLESAPFELREFLGDTLKSLGLRAYRKGLELACEIAPDVPDLLLGDAHRLRQVVVNLIGNAIKFTDVGEVVAGVTVDRRTDHEVVLHLCVADTGIGIPPDKFASIFEAFEQADCSTTRRFGGTGLGLAISARLVQLMGGRMWVESEVGRGSTFHCTAIFGLADEGARAAAAPPELLQGLRVLVVDDNATNRRILAEMLSSWGMRPALASSADEAVDALRQQQAAGTPFGLVVTDVNMPGQSGFDLVRAAQAQGALCRGVIVMLTSGDRQDDLNLCHELGVTTYLIKPVKQSELFNAILQALGAAHAEDWQSAALAAERRPARPLKILLAEDSLINQKLALGLLERWGHRVVVAGDGNEAVRCVQNEPFDLILMDIQMPDCDGLEATRCIRACERSCGGHVPIVAMTAHALQGDRERCLAAGMDDYLTKPIRSEQLFLAVERHGGATAGKAAPGTTVCTEPAAAAAGPPADAGAATDQLVNWVAALAATGGDEGILRDVAGGFCEEAPTLAGNLRTFWAAQDWKRLQRAAHTLKTGFATFGVTAARTAAAAIEVACQAPEPQICEADLAAIERWTTLAAAEMRSRLQSVAPSARI